MLHQIIRLTNWHKAELDERIEESQAAWEYTWEIKIEHGIDINSDLALWRCSCGIYHAEIEDLTELDYSSAKCWKCNKHYYDN